MNEKMRRALGFLGLVEDDHHEFSQTTAPRPFAEAPAPVPAPEPDYARPAPPPVRATAPAPRQAPTLRVQSAPRPATPLRAQAAPTPANRTSSIAFLDSQGQVQRPRPMSAPGSTRGSYDFSSESDVEIFAPLRFNESNRLTDQLRMNRAVVLVVHQAGPAEARRIIDFAAGTAYAMTATIETLEKGAVYLVCPHGVHVGPETRERLRSSNYQSLDA